MGSKPILAGTITILDCNINSNRRLEHPELAHRINSTVICISETNLNNNTTDRNIPCRESKGSYGLVWFILPKTKRMLVLYHMKTK